MKFDTAALSLMLLQGRCALLRINPLTVPALLLFGTGLLCCALWLPYLYRDLAQTEAAAERELRANRSLPERVAAAPSQNVQRVHEFYATLGENGYAEQQLKTLFDIAAKTGLKLNEGEYKSSYERNSDTLAYQIQLPVVGQYPAIRQFCEQALLAIPFASLDEISFKREAIGNANLEAKLRFTLYLAGSKAVAAGQS